jgi:hypothetical protein
MTKTMRMNRVMFSIQNSPGMHFFPDEEDVCIFGANLFKGGILGILLYGDTIFSTLI